MGRHAPDPMPTISVRSTKWSGMARPLVVQAWRALLMTVIKLRKSEYSSTRPSSRADQNSPPRSWVRLMRSKAVAAGAFNSLLTPHYNSSFYLGQSVFQRTCALLQCQLLLGPKFDFDVLFHAFAADHRRNAQTDVADFVATLH